MTAPSDKVRRWEGKMKARRGTLAATHTSIMDCQQTGRMHIAKSVAYCVHCLRFRLNPQAFVGRISVRMDRVKSR